MATDQRTLPGTFATDADFRSWGSGLSAQFAAIGLIKTSDTGQIDWTTVLKPTATNQQRGYEIWRFNDALQATRPVFIRIDFGSGGSTTSPGLWATVATGTNGAGALTGQVGTTKQVAPTGVTSATSYCSGSSSRLSLAANPSAISQVILLLIERPKTGAGVDTGDGIVRFLNNGNTGAGYQFVPWIGAIPADQAQNPALDSNLGGVSSLGADVMLSPTVVFYGKSLFVSWCAYKITEITALTPITFVHLGATRTYMPLALNSGAHNIQASVGYGIAMLWE